MTRRRGDWIETWSGKRFYPLDPRPADVDLADIVWALGFQCRYNGHSAQFYSVAEHSVLVSRLLKTTDEKLWGLFHDSAEAYLPDVARPIKASLDGFDEIEERVLDAIAQALGLPWPVPPAVWQADLEALAIEKPAVFPSSKIRWPAIEGIRPEQLIPLQFLSPEAARAVFLERFRMLVESA